VGLNSLDQRRIFNAAVRRLDDDLDLTRTALAGLEPIFPGGLTPLTPPAPAPISPALAILARDSTEIGSLSHVVSVSCRACSIIIKAAMGVGLLWRIESPVGILLMD
jgi:hypothetical protein